MVLGGRTGASASAERVWRGLSLTFVIVGLAREVDSERARDLALETLEASAASGQAADARVWPQDPPASTYPAGIAFHAVADQGDPQPFLRRVREAVFLEGRRMDSPDALMDAACAAGGLDFDRLNVDFGSPAMLERFGEDLERGREVPEEHTSEGTGRVAIPSLELHDADGASHWAVGTHEWAEWRAAALAAGVSRETVSPPSIEDALRRFGTMTTAEVALVCDLPGHRAPAELWQLAQERRVSVRTFPVGEVWSLPM